MLMYLFCLMLLFLLLILTTFEVCVGGTISYRFEKKKRWSFLGEWNLRFGASSSARLIA